MSWLPLIIFSLCIGLVAEYAWQWKGRAIVERGLEWVCRGFYDGERR
jgi:hypothetical protein